MHYLGIDIGSLFCDAVLIDGGSDIVASTVVPTGARNREAIARATKRSAPDSGDFARGYCGGVANNSGVVRAISSLMDCEVSVPQNPDTVGALGAAIIAKEKSAYKR
jgi:activator of 2-hydroxyglutaryl-CoA dehydratase